MEWDMEKKELLNIRELSVSFCQYEGKGTQKTELPVISGLDVTVREGEIVAVIGSSGSGKSLLAHAVFGLLPQNAVVKGEISYRGVQMTAKEAERLRGRELALVPQSVNYLDPLMKVGKQMTNGKKDAETRKRLETLLERYCLEKSVCSRYPFELSGGMTRRVLLITALMQNPGLIIADEPTPGMELALAAKVMQDFRDFADSGGGVLFITHDLELAVRTADRIVVFYAGTTVEEAAAEDFCSERRLRHPYTRALFRAMPEHGFQPLPGAQPYVKEMPKGCPFGPRCAYRVEQCGGEIPMRQARGGTVRCIRYREGEAELDEA